MTATLISPGPNQWHACDLTFSQGKKKGLFVPGVVIETAGGNAFLIGEINELGGVCDDCPSVYPTTKIVRFMKLVNYKRNQPEPAY